MAWGSHSAGRIYNGHVALERPVFEKQSHVEKNTTVYLDNMYNEENLDGE